MYLKGYLLSTITCCPPPNMFDVMMYPTILKASAKDEHKKGERYGGKSRKSLSLIYSVYGERSHTGISELRDILDF